MKTYGNICTVYVPFVEFYQNVSQDLKAVHMSSYEPYSKMPSYRLTQWFSTCLRAG